MMNDETWNSKLWLLPVRIVRMDTTRYSDEVNVEPTYVCVCTSRNSDNFGTRKSAWTGSQREWKDLPCRIVVLPGSLIGRQFSIRRSSPPDAPPTVETTVIYIGFSTIMKRQSNDPAYAPTINLVILLLIINGEDFAGCRKHCGLRMTSMSSFVFRIMNRQCAEQTYDLSI